MAEGIDSAVLKKTQEILGGVIKKPLLTDKNLKRPPFRFLHDIITNVIKTTGFMKGLYTSEELISDNVKDKESKIAFLQKAIDVLAFSINEPVNLKPSKVVAGHDPEKTNIFLQTLGNAVKHKTDSKEAVKAVLEKSGTTNHKSRRASVDKRAAKTLEKNGPQSTSKAEAGKKSLGAISKDTSKSKESDKTRSHSKETKSRDKERSKDKLRSTKDDSKTKTQKPESRTLNDSSNPKTTSDRSHEVLDSIGAIAENGFSDEVPGHGTNFFPDMQTNEFHLMNGDLPSENFVKPQERQQNHFPQTPRPPSAVRARHPDVNKDEGNQDVDPSLLLNLSVASSNGTSTLQRPPSARPSSSRPAPPRIRVRHIVDHEEPRPLTAKPVENVIVDQKDNSEGEDEDEAFVIAEEKPIEEDAVELPVIASDPQETPDEDKGSLVKQLLETKKDLEGGSQHLSKKVEIDKSQMSTAAINKARDASNKELVQLRSSIQSVSRTAHPLGRVLDYLQEDMDSMKMELKTWKEEHRQNLIALRREKSITESILEPLQSQLEDLEQVVQDQLDANSVLKASIHRNEERIQRMVATLNRKS